MNNLTISILLTAALSACAVDAPSTDLAADEAPSPLAQQEGDGRGPIAPVDDWGTLGDPTRDGRLPFFCDDLQSVGATVLDAAQQCEKDADCTSQMVEAVCIRSFLCPVPLNQGRDLPKLAREARALSLAYQQACTKACAVASCAAPVRTYCEATTKRCKSDY